MKKEKKNTTDCRGSRGGVLAMVALLLFVFIGIAALAIDIGYLTTTRNELQNVADAAALAGAGYLGSVYNTLTPVQQQTQTFTRSEIVSVVQTIAEKNQAAGLNIDINDNATDIIIGRWDFSSQTISPETLIVPTAVYVKARRDEQANTPIRTFFANVFGVDTMSVEADATAALSGPSWIAEGELITPFALSEHQFPSNCTELIEFSPTTDSCASWHNFFDPINASKMADKLIGFIEGDVDCKYCDPGDLNGPDWLTTNFNINKTPDAEETPASSTGDSFEFQGGTIASLFNGEYLDEDYDGNTGTALKEGNPVDPKLPMKPAPMLALFDYFRYRDGDGDDAIWSATIPIYADNIDGTCMNPNTSLEIVGFAKIQVIKPQSAPLNSIQVQVDCNYSFIDGRGGGGGFGPLTGVIPNLVE